MRQHYDYYHLSAEDYAALLERANGICDMCGELARTQWNKTPLVIDHDHNLGWSAVRGLICYSCNAALAQLESRGRNLRTRASEAAAYLANPWHVRAGMTSYTCPADCEISLHKRGKYAPSGPRRARGVK